MYILEYDELRIPFLNNYGKLPMYRVLSLSLFLTFLHIVALASSS